MFKCAEKTGVNFAQLVECADGESGSDLMFWNGINTTQLVPQHEFVPWITINGVSGPTK